MTVSYIIAISVILLGMLLILVDIILIPGGVVLIMGILIILGTLVYGYNAYGFVFALHIGVATLVMAAILGFLIWKLRLWRVMQLKEQEDKATGFVSFSDTKEKMIGKTGKTFSVMRPGGIVKIDDKKYDAVTEGGLLEKGEPVKVVDVREAQLVVRKTE